MARDDAPGVEFVGETNDDASDEELPGPSQRQRANPRWVLAGGAVVLVGAALIARSVSGGHEPGSPFPSPTFTSPTAAASVNGEPILVPPESNRPIDPRRIPFAAPLCQRPASCSEVTTLPDGTVAALFDSFSGVNVTAASTVLSTRQDKMAPDVVNRTITARAGSTSISIRIRMAVPIDSRDVEQHRGATTSTTSVTEIALGYVIEIKVSRAGGPISVVTVEHLATDSRLLLP